MPAFKGRTGCVNALVVGEQSLLSGGYRTKILEWELPDPRAFAREAQPQAKPKEPRAERWVASMNGSDKYSWISCMQVCQ